MLLDASLPAWKCSPNSSPNSSSWSHLPSAPNHLHHMNMHVSVCGNPHRWCMGACCVRVRTEPA
jgi:hypothetical protein